MRHLFILSTITALLLNLVCNDLMAADPVIKIRGHNANSVSDMIDFLGISPSSSDYPNVYTYYAEITNDATIVPTDATISYQWIPTGGNSPDLKNPSVKIKWDNTKNYNNGVATKSLRLKVTFTWISDGQSKIKECYSVLPNNAALPQPIEVKYISEPTSLSFNGSTVGNNSSLQYACGAAQKTISIPVVVTDPNAPVTYFFYYPAGWSGPASSNVPSVNVNTHVNSNGKIIVEAKRNDTNNFRTKITIDITRPLPTKPVINSPDILLCAPKTITASANNATSYQWSTTGGITANSPGNTNSAQITGVSDGTVKVAAVSSVCAMTSAFSSPINVKRSAPQPASLLVSANGGGAPDFMCNGAGVQLNAYTAEPGTVFGAWKSSDPANTILNGNGGSAYFNSYVNNCYGINIVVSNCFGQVQKGITICVDNCAKENPVYAIYPNPASDYLNVKFEDVSDFSALPVTLQILAETDFKEVKTIDLKSVYTSNTFPAEKTVSVNVAGLPKGVYYLHLSYSNGSIDKNRIVLK